MMDLWLWLMRGDWGRIHHVENVFLNWEQLLLLVWICHLPNELVLKVIYIMEILVLVKEIVALLTFSSFMKSCCLNKSCLDSSKDQVNVLESGRRDLWGNQVIVLRELLQLYLIRLSSQRAQVKLVANEVEQGIDSKVSNELFDSRVVKLGDSLEAVSVCYIIQENEGKSELAFLLQGNLNFIVQVQAQFYIFPIFVIVYQQVVGLGLCEFTGAGQRVCKSGFPHASWTNNNDFLHKYSIFN